MSADKQRFLELIDKFLQGSISAEEEELLNNFINSFPEINSWDEVLPEQKQEIEKRMLERLQSTIASDRTPVVYSNRKFFLINFRKYAAAILIIIAGSVYIWHQSASRRVQLETKSPSLTSVNSKAAQSGAILTLADGLQIPLDSIQNGIVAVQNGVELELLDTCLVYKATDKFTAEKEIVYNKITTPRGKWFQVVLPDGSKVWLNAASSLCYPVLFGDKQRLVEVSGEAFFEVAKKTIPFIVKISDKFQIKVLGTHFNVNAYDDEKSMNTTLLEGKVNVACNNETAFLKPGQQARIIQGTNGNIATKKIQVLNNVDINKVIAWKNGVFDFQNAKLDEVMRQLARWYNLEVIYENEIPDIKFYGKMGRDVSLSKLLAFLKESDVHYRLEGERKVIITK